MANEAVLGPRKTMFILVIVVGCFAVLWPRILSPLILGSTKDQLQPNQFDREAGCCEVLFDTEVAVHEVLNEVCSSAVGSDGKLSPYAAAECRKAVNSTCGVDIAAFLKRNENVGKSTRKLLDMIKTSNSSCLKEHFGVPTLSLATHIQINSWTQADTVKQERSPIRGSGPHPALRERGRAIPAGAPTPPSRGPVPLPPHARVRSPLSVYFDIDVKPPPIPGMRPPLGSAGGPVAPPKSSMGFVMPFYTICIIVFFVYTLSKILFKRTGTVPYESITPDPQFRRRVFRADSRASPDTKLVVTAISGLVAEVQHQMEASYAQSQQRAQNAPDDAARPYTNGTVLSNNAPVRIIASEYKDKIIEESELNEQEPKEFTPEPKEPTPEPNQLSPEPKEPTPELKEQSPEPNESTSEPKELSPEPKAPTPELKEQNPEPNGRTPEPKELSPEPKDPTPELKEPSLESKKPTPEPKELSEEPKEPAPKPNEFTPEPEIPITEPKESTLEPKQPKPELKESTEIKEHTSEAKESRTEHNGHELKETKPEQLELKTSTLEAADNLLKQTANGDVKRRDSLTDLVEDFLTTETNEELKVLSTQELEENKVEVEKKQSTPELLAEALREDSSGKESDEEDVLDAEKSSVKVLGMETTAHAADGGAWPSAMPSAPAPASSTPAPAAPPPPVASILLPPDMAPARVLVDFVPRPPVDAASRSPLVVSGKMTLSLIQDSPRDTPERDLESTQDDFTTASAITQTKEDDKEEVSDEEIEEEIEIEEIEEEVEEEEEEEEEEGDARVVKK